MENEMENQSLQKYSTKALILMVILSAYIATH